MLRPGERIVIGVSGGADSIGLLHALLELKEYKLEPIVAHMNHGIRGKEAKRDALFVKEVAASLNLEFEHGQTDVPRYRKKHKLSLEEAARILRYEFLEEARKKYTADKIATAHTLDDQAETVLMRLIRGSGPKGLSGILPVSNGIIIRPLIETRRYEIEKYLAARDIGWIEDSTNKLRTMLRNRIRLDLLPALESYNPRIKESLSRASDLLRDVDEFMEREAKKFFNGIFKRRRSELHGDLRKFKRLHKALRSTVLRLAAEELMGSLKNVTSLHLSSADEYLLSDSASGVIEFPDELVVVKGYDAFLVTTKTELERDFSYTIPSVGKWSFPEFYVDIEKSSGKALAEGREDVAYFDPKSVDFPIEVSSFRSGDRFIPLGMKSPKKIKNFFIDCKVPRFMRYRIPVFRSAGKVFWIGGMRIDDRFKVVKKGKKALKFSLRMPDSST
jgi:tRNA(Ile)-lysidine synthase